MKFGDTVKLNQPELRISRKHDEWLAENDHPRYNRHALDFAVTQLAKRARRRMGTVSASSLGECKRYQQFVFIGMRKLPFDAKNAMKMQNGTMVHLRWQMAGLTAGWLVQAEVGVSSTKHRLVGTMDGVSDDDRIVEIKSINMNGFSRVHTFGPMWEHLFQMASYMLCTGKPNGTFIYECKDNQEYLEIPVKSSDLPMAEVADTATEVWWHIHHKQLYEPLNKCLDREGWVYNSCPFRDRCLEIHTWEEAH